MFLLQISISTFFVERKNKTILKLIRNILFLLATPRKTTKGIGIYKKKKRPENEKGGVGVFVVYSTSKTNG